MAAVGTQLPCFLDSGLAIEVDTHLAIDANPRSVEDAVRAWRIVRREESGDEHRDRRVAAFLFHRYAEGDATIGSRGLALRVIGGLHVDERDVQVRALARSGARRTDLPALGHELAQRGVRYFERHADPGVDVAPGKFLLGVSRCGK